MIQTIFYTDFPEPRSTLQAWVVYEGQYYWKVIYQKNHKEVKEEVFKMLGKAQASARSWVTQEKL